MRYLAVQNFAPQNEPPRPPQAGGISPPVDQHAERKGSHTVNKEYMQRNELYTLDLRTHTKRLPRKIVFFSKLEIMHGIIISWYLAIHHYH